MIESTLSSTNKSEPHEVNITEDRVVLLNEKSTKPSLEDTWLSEIPLFNKSQSPQEKLKDLPDTTSSSMEPSLCENEPLNEEIVEGQYEYEFTNLWDGCLYSVYLYDTSDLSACEKVVNRPVTEGEISYSPTGNGFITDDGFKYTFCKNPLKKISASVAQTSYESKLRRRTSIKVRTADDIISSL